MLHLQPQRVRSFVGQSSCHRQRRCTTVSHSDAAAWSSTGSSNPSGGVPGDSAARTTEAARSLVEKARETILSDEGSTQQLAQLCGHYKLSEAQKCVLQELEQAMTKASKIFWAVGFAIVGGALVEGATSGTLTSLMTNVTNTIHYVVLAVLTATASRSFHRAAHSGNAGDGNALPSVMIAITRLASVLSQFSSMALASMVVTVIAATQLWQPLQLFTGCAIAVVMLTRGVACMMLVTDSGTTRSIVSAAAAIQSKSTLGSWKERFAVTVAASNALHYPFLSAFNKARVRRVQQHNDQRRAGAAGAAAPAAAAAAAGAAAAAAPAADKNLQPGFVGGENGADGHGLVEEQEYEFNEGEQLMLQVMTDEMRMAGYNHVYLSLGVILFFAAHIGTREWLQGVLNMLMLNDTMGTAIVMFMVAKHFETAVVTSGNDITSLMRGLGSTSGLTKLFTRVGNLAKGVIIGQAITIIWNVHPLVIKLVTKTLNTM
eukprot:jgi/Ulvmu1/12649/UM094_0005.1